MTVQSIFKVCLYQQPLEWFLKSNYCPVIQEICTINVENLPSTTHVRFLKFSLTGAVLCSHHTLLELEESSPHLWGPVAME